MPRGRETRAVCSTQVNCGYKSIDAAGPIRPHQQHLVHLALLPRTIER
jgi:hypothetical protein